VFPVWNQHMPVRVSCRVLTIVLSPDAGDGDAVGGDAMDNFELDEAAVGNAAASDTDDDDDVLV
jgi:hypothetical protein